MKKLLSLFFIFGLSINTQVVLADDDDDVDEACPVGLFVKDAVTGDFKTIDEEFGEGVNAKTQCLENRKEIKLVMQINKACRDTAVVPDGMGGYRIKNHPTSCAPGRAYGLAQMKNMIRDYTVTHGIDANKLDLKVVVHGGGGFLMMKNNPMVDNNIFEKDVKDLMADGVKFYFCQNTVRGFIKRGFLPAENADSRIIDDVEYVTAGLTAVADLQEEGYIYVQP
jgi:intracellular sulfur oxidation DsrE/DsrF family protein